MDIASVSTSDQPGFCGQKARAKETTFYWSESEGTLPNGVDITPSVTLQVPCGLEMGDVNDNGG